MEDHMCYVRKNRHIIWNKDMAVDKREIAKERTVPCYGIVLTYISVFYRRDFVHLNYCFRFAAAYYIQWMFIYVFSAVFLN